MLLLVFILGTIFLLRSYSHMGWNAVIRGWHIYVIFLAMGVVSEICWLEERKREHRG